MPENAACCLVSESARVVQSFQVVFPEVVQGVYVLIVGKVGDTEDVVARNLAFVNLEFDEGVGLFVAPSELEVLVSLYFEDVGNACLEMSCEVAPGEDECFLVLLHLVGHPLGKSLGSAYETPDDVWRFRVERLFYVYALLGHGIMVLFSVYVIQSQK